MLPCLHLSDAVALTHWLKSTVICTILLSTSLVFGQPMAQSQEHTNTPLLNSAAEKGSANHASTKKESAKLKALNEAIEANPEDASLYAKRSLEKMHMEDGDGAAADLNEAIKLNPEEPMIFRTTVEMAIRSNDLTELSRAWPHMKKGLELAPDDASMWLTNARFLGALNSDFEALEAADKALELSKDKYDGLIVKGFLLLKTKQYNVAETMLEEAVKLDANKAPAYLGLVQIDLRNRAYEQALARCNRAIELDDQNAESFKSRAQVYFKTKDYKSAVADLDQAIKLSESNAELRYLRGDANFNLKEFSLAIADLSEAIYLKEDYREAYSKRGLARMMSKDHEGACTDFEKAIELGDASAVKMKENVCK